MQVLNLFPTDVYIEKNNEIDNKKISEIILKREKTESSRDVTNVGGWQSTDDLHKDERFSEILKNISKCFYSIYKNYSYRNELEWYITNMWANVNRYKDYNISHIHTGTDWSFVYYVEVPKDSGNLVFVDPRIRKRSSVSDGINETYDNPFTHDIYVVAPLVGKFVLFPSYLEHYVECNTTENKRISISGNIKVGNTF